MRRTIEALGRFGFVVLFAARFLGFFPLRDAGALKGPNGFEELRKSIKEGQDFTKDIAAILHERSELELSYARSLSKLATKINKATKLILGTTQNAWQEVALQMENEADTHRYV
ncbi:nostrin-like [Stegodyphus dumicola]|uniref:nostrin-like n=1 Tax=Stegodyphus dumicola TaxID=202533 RepID=UPI0015AC2F91|nr:nostrin-like [Stegodyphus dumicola]